MKTIGTKIQTLRKNKGITQEQLAEVLTVSAQAVSKWENGVSMPDIHLLPVIARYFGITMDELFNYRLDALNYKERFIRFMVDNGVLKFGEFKLQSGRISPYFIDNGCYRSGAQVMKLGEFYAECIRENNIQTNILLSSSVRAIPAMMATNMILYQKYGMDVEYCFEKDVVIGRNIKAGDHVTLIEDVLTSGKSIRTTLEKLKSSEGVTVAGVIIALDRMEKGMATELSALDELRREFGIEIHTIVNMDEVIRAMEHGIIAGTEYIEKMKAYRETYGGR